MNKKESKLFGTHGSNKGDLSANKKKYLYSKNSPWDEEWDELLKGVTCDKTEKEKIMKKEKEVDEGREVGGIECNRDWENCTKNYMRDIAEEFLKRDITDSELTKICLRFDLEATTNGENYTPLKEIFKDLDIAQAKSETKKSDLTLEKIDIRLARLEKKVKQATCEHPDEEIDFHWEGSEGAKVCWRCDKTLEKYGHNHLSVGGYVGSYIESSRRLYDDAKHEHKIKMLEDERSKIELKIEYKKQRHEEDKQQK